MAIDPSKVILAAVQAALEDGVSAAKPAKKRRRHIPGRAFLLGAGVVTAARLASGSRGRELLESVQDRLADFEDRYLAEDGEPGDEEYAEDEEYVEDEDYPEDEETPAEDEEYAADDYVEDETSA